MSGSLVLLFVVIVIGALAMQWLSRLQPDRQRGTTFPYYARRNLFSPAERAFLGVLEEAVGSTYRVFGKVRLADVLGVRKGTSGMERQRALNRILQKHVDFILCRPQDLSVVALVELDDATHGRADRRARDAFLERACDAAGVRLLRFPAQGGYVLNQLRSEVMALERSAGGGVPERLDVR